MDGNRPAPLTWTTCALIALAVFMVLDLIRFAFEPPREHIVRSFKIEQSPK